VQSLQGANSPSLLVDVEAGVNQHRHRTRLGELADQAAVERTGLWLDALDSCRTVDMNHGRDLLLHTFLTGNVTTMNGASKVSSKYSAWRSYDPILRI
jgi:hypothetical protein